MNDKITYRHRIKSLKEFIDEMPRNDDYIIAMYLAEKAYLINRDFEDLGDEFDQKRVLALMIEIKELIDRNYICDESKP